MTKKTYPVTIDKKGNVDVSFKHPTTPDGWSDNFPKDWKPKPTPRLAIDREIESYLYA